jgi:cobalt-zinc-cadmium resistance protein CzcA
VADQQKTIGRLLSEPLFWVLVYGVMVAYGAYALWKIPVEVLPAFNFPQVSVITHEPGATATELETQITWPIEGEILALPNVISLESTMGDGEVENDVRFREGTDPQTDLQSINGAIDRAHARMPASVHPLAEVMGNAINEVADYTAKIPVTIEPTEVQREVLANVVPALRALPGVQRVDAYGAGDESLWVQPSLTALVRYRVPITSITDAIQQNVLLQPGGYLSQGHQDAFIEVRDLPTSGAQLRNIPIASATGPVPLGNLARIVRGPVPTFNRVYFDEERSIALVVFKQPGASTEPVTQAVRTTLAQTAGQLPQGVRWVSIYDQGHLVHVVGSDLTRNLLIGGVLAIAVMLWVLGASGGVWVLAVSIPVSLLMGIAGLYAAGDSLNLMTLGALTVAVGLLADDGIIVLESIYHRWEQGDDRRRGILNGLREIASPDVTGTLTTVAVFVPLLFVGGLAGLFFVPFALAMTLALLASLIISLSLVPLSLSFVPARARKTPTTAARAMDKLRVWNMRIFQGAVRHPIASVTGCVVILVASIAGLALVPLNFLPLPNEGVLLESFTLPPGSSMLDTEDAVMTIARRLHADPAVAHISSRIGSSASTMYTEPAYAGEIQVTLKPSVNVNSLSGIAARIQRESQMPGVQVGIDTPTIERVGESLSGLPQPFVLRVFGNDIRELRTLAGQVTARLRTVPSLTGIFNNDAYPVTEIQLEPQTTALAAAGINAAQLQSQISPLLNGEIVAQVPEGNVPLDIYVRLADAPQKSLNALRQLPIRTAGWTPLGQLAKLTLVSTPTQIRHINGARALEIVATPTGSLGGAIAASRRALASLRMPPGYRISFGGLYAQIESAAIALGIAAVAAFVLMTGIMILQFEGLLVPGLLLLQIPLAFSGGAAALIVSGVGLNAVGLIGFLTLIGIGLNHGIVLLYRARRNEAAGMAVDDAVSEAVSVRFRPIALTTLTAVLGMLPTAFGWGQGAAPEQGLAVVVMGGIFWSALLSANLIPALYVHQRRKHTFKSSGA